MDSKTLISDALTGVTHQIDNLFAAVTAANEALTAKVAELNRTIKRLSRPFLFGAAYGGNSDPSALEKEAGVPLGIRVTYWTLNDAGITSAIKQIKADHVAGRRPWVSFKFSTAKLNWDNVVAGKFDGALDRLDAELESLGHEVWLTLHHEPEGDEPDMQDWVRAMRHAYSRVRGANIVRFASFTGWTNIYGGNNAYTIEALWPGDDVCDGISFDPYNEYASYKHPTGEKHWTDLIAYFDYLQAFAGEHNVIWAIRETGLTDKAVASGHAGAKTWITDTAAKAKDRGCAGWCYFASDLNLQPGDIVGVDRSAVKRADFINAMRRFALR